VSAAHMASFFDAFVGKFSKDHRSDLSDLHNVCSSTATIPSSQLLIPPLPPLLLIFFSPLFSPAPFIR
jgi:hypothetical protein